MHYSFAQTAGINEEEIQGGVSRLRTYTESLREDVMGASYAIPEAGLSALFDPAQVEEAHRVVETLGPASHVVLVGIGGSSAGTRAVYEALATPEGPTLLVLEGIDTRHMADTLLALEHVPLEDMAIVVVSKSGTTTETLANAAVLLEELKEVHGEAIVERVVVVTDAGTPLAHVGTEEHMLVVPMPEEVGGRFSLYTTACLVPLALLGIDIEELVASARESMTRALGGEEDAPCAGAALLYAHADHGTRIHVLFPQDERLQGIAEWWEQLLAESIGKEETEAGAPFGEALLPVLMSARQLHSTAQLFFSGFEGIFTTFITATPAQGKEYHIAQEGVGGLLAMGGDRTYGRITSALGAGVREAYEDAHLPHAVLDLGECTPHSVGALLAHRMLEVMCLAHLFSINAFDQPHVELYKEKTRRMLVGGVE